MRELLIIGAGAAGLFAAQWLEGIDYAILEHNDKAGAKILISGGGRANVTNRIVDASHYQTNDSDFVAKILNKFDNRALLAWLRTGGCEPVERKPSQLFCPHSARELLHLLRSSRVRYGVDVRSVERTDAHFLVHTNRGVFQARAILVASGGLSYKKLGASPIGLQIAEAFGHTIAPTAPALVGLTLQKEQAWMKELAGISVAATVEVERKRFTGNILFAHRGISGPAILNASLYWKKGHIKIAFLSKLPKLLPHKQLSTQLPLPKRFVKAFLAHIGVPDVQVKKLKPWQRQKLQLLCSYSFAPSGTFGYERAEVMRGGVALSELDEGMQSRFVEGLFFAGEVCDATGELGGYNFQWAFSSAHAAAVGIRNYLKKH